MRSFEIVTIPEALAAAVRRERRDGFGNTDLAPVEVDASPGFPCRLCLEDARVGERVLLFSFSPITEAAPYRTVGPIFVHEAPCTRFERTRDIPEVLRTRTVALRGYDARYTALHDIDLTEGEHLEERAERMLADPRVHHVDVHFARPGCYACTLSRRPSARPGSPFVAWNELPELTLIAVPTRFESFGRAWTQSRRHRPPITIRSPAVSKERDRPRLTRQRSQSSNTIRSNTGAPMTTSGTHGEPGFESTG